jgi:hypothetical protein
VAVLVVVEVEVVEASMSYFHKNNQQDNIDYYNRSVTNYSNNLHSIYQHYHHRVLRLDKYHRH